MEVFQQHPTILQGNEAKRIIKNFNKLAKVLLEFELLYHRGWIRQVWFCVIFSLLVRKVLIILGSLDLEHFANLMLTVVC